MGLDLQHRPRSRIPARPLLGGGGSGWASGCRSDGSPNDSNLRGCSPGRGAHALQPAVGFPHTEDSGDARSPRVEGLLASFPTRDPHSQHPTRVFRGFAFYRGALGVSWREIWGARRRCRRCTATSLWGSLRALTVIPLPPEQAAPLGAAGAGGAPPRLGGPRASRPGRDAGTSGDRGLCPRAGGRPGLRALRAALHVTAARTARCGPEGGGLAAGAAGSQARALSRAGLGAALRSQGRGRGSGGGGGGGGRARGPAGEELRLAVAWLRGHPGNGPNRGPWACDWASLSVSVKRE